MLEGASCGDIGLRALRYFEDSMTILGRRLLASRFGFSYDILDAWYKDLPIIC